MHPEPLFYINDIGINGYLLAFGGAPLPVFLVLVLLGRERGLSWRIVTEAACLGGALALLAGALLSLLVQEHLHEFAAQWSLLYMTLFVGFVWLYFRRVFQSRARAAASSQIFFPALALYLAIARLGCFMAGCCHGKPAWNVPWAVIVDDPLASTIYRGIPIHPTQLYQSLGNLAIFALLLTVRNHPRYQGKMGWLFFVLYGSVRFFVEFYRGDFRTMIGLLSLNQAVCLGFILVGLLGWRGWTQMFPLRGLRTHAAPTIETAGERA